MIVPLFHVRHDSFSRMVRAAEERVGPDWSPEPLETWLTKGFDVSVFFLLDWVSLLDWW